MCGLCIYPLFFWPVKFCPPYLGLAFCMPGCSLRSSLLHSLLAVSHQPCLGPSDQCCLSLAWHLIQNQVHFKCNMFSNFLWEELCDIYYHLQLEVVNILVLVSLMHGAEIVSFLLMGQFHFVCVCLCIVWYVYMYMFMCVYIYGSLKLMSEAAFSILCSRPGLSESPELTSLTRVGGRRPSGSSMHATTASFPHGY